MEDVISNNKDFSLVLSAVFSRIIALLLDKCQLQERGDFSTKRGRRTSLSPVSSASSVWGHCIVDSLKNNRKESIVPLLHRACQCLCRHYDCILCTVNTYSYTVPLLSCDCALVYMLMHWIHVSPVFTALVSRCVIGATTFDAATVEKRTVMCS